METLFFRRYDQAGWPDQAPVVLIHGAGGNLAYWPPYVRRLPAASVYALDLPGHGKSEGPGCDSINDYADAVLAFMADEQLPPCLIAGHSMGGAVAQAIARQAPEQVAGLALVATGARLPVSPTLLDGLATDFEKTVDMLAGWVFSRTIDGATRNEYRRQLLRLAPPLLISDFRACAAFDATDDLAGFEMPALVIGGDDDRMTPPRCSQFLAERIPNTEFHLLEATGHMIPFERPELLAQLIGDFHRRLAVDSPQRRHE